MVVQSILVDRLLIGLLALAALLMPRAALTQAIPIPGTTTADVQITSATSVAASGITFRGVGTVLSLNNGGSGSPGLPTGTAVDDILICVVESRSDVAPTITSGGWNTVFNDGTGANHHAAVFWRRATGGAQDTPTVSSNGGTNSFGARIYGFVGVDTTTAIEDSGFSSSGSDLTTEAPAIATASPGAMLVFAAMMADNHTGFSVTTGNTVAGWQGTAATTFSSLNLNEDLSLGIMYGVTDDAGAKGPFVMTRTGAANAVSHGAVIALKPAVTPAGNFTINKPTATVQDDVLIATIVAAPAGVAILAPSGWTEIQQLRNGNTNPNQLRVYRKTATAAEGASYSWYVAQIPAAFANGIVGSIVRFQNVPRVVLLDGKQLAQTMQGEIAAEAAAFVAASRMPPGLAAVLVGDNPASQIYVRNKRKACEKVGLVSWLHEMPRATAQAELLKLIDRLNADPAVHGILVQLPLPKQIDEAAVIRAVAPAKDVDGFGPENLGLLAAGFPRFLPCTPHGVQQLLVRNGIAIEGAHVVVVGRSETVGKPTALLLMQRGPGGGPTGFSPFLFLCCQGNSVNDSAYLLGLSDDDLKALARGMWTTLRHLRRPGSAVSAPPSGPALSASAAAPVRASHDRGPDDDGARDRAGAGRANSAPARGVRRSLAHRQLLARRGLRCRHDPDDLRSLADWQLVWLRRPRLHRHDRPFRRRGRSSACQPRNEPVDHCRPLAFGRSDGHLTAIGRPFHQVDGAARHSGRCRHALFAH